MTGGAAAGELGTRRRKPQSSRRSKVTIRMRDSRMINMNEPTRARYSRLWPSAAGVVDVERGEGSVPIKAANDWDVHHDGFRALWQKVARQGYL